MTTQRVGRALLASPHALEHDASSRYQNDRVANRPRTLRALLRWAEREYAAEPPVKLHRMTEDAGGGPAMTGQAASYLGFSQIAEPNDWRRLAEAKDAEGSYRTPMRAAIERIGPEPRRRFLRDLLTNVLYPSEVAAHHGIPEWCAGDVMYQSLNALYDGWRDRPLPSRSWVDLSQSQQAAELATA
jgi:hypothetical protein